MLNPICRSRILCFVLPMIHLNYTSFSGLSLYYYAEQFRLYNWMMHVLLSMCYGNLKYRFCSHVVGGGGGGGGVPLIPPQKC